MIREFISYFVYQQVEITQVTAQMRGIIAASIGREESVFDRKESPRKLSSYLYDTTIANHYQVFW